MAPAPFLPDATAGARVRSMPGRKGLPNRKSLQRLRGSRREEILRRHRIERLRIRIERGEYQVAAVEIAAAMLREGLGWESNAA